MKSRFMAYATAAALTLGTVLSSGVPVFAKEPGGQGQIQETGSDHGGGNELVQQDQAQQPDDGGNSQSEESSPAEPEEAAASVVEAEEIQNRNFAEKEEDPVEEETVQSYGEIGWYPLAAFGWSSLADAQKDPAFNISNYNAQYNAYYGVPTVPGFSKIDVSAGAGNIDPAGPEEPGKEDGPRDWNRRPPKPPCCSSDDDDDDDDDDTTTVTTAVNIGNGTTFSVADPALLPAEFANGAFYSVTAAGVVYFNNIDLSGRYFQTWDNSGNMIATLVLVDENLEIVEIDRAELVNIGTKTYLSFEAEGAAYAAVSSDTQLIYKTICGFDGVVVNGSVVMEF